MYLVVINIVQFNVGCIDDSSYNNIYFTLYSLSKSTLSMSSTDSDLDQKMVENFVQEGIIMKNFNHPHVLSLLGLCLGYRKEPMVILPFMANGDLRTFVKDKSRVNYYVSHYIYCLLFYLHYIHECYYTFLIDNAIDCRRKKELFVHS